MSDRSAFWATLDDLFKNHKLVIDRPKGTAHPRYPDFIYPLDYGYLEGTSASDGGGIDVFLGSGKGKIITGIAVTLDTAKKDSEIKILVDCAEEDKKIIREALNRKHMRAILIDRFSI
jgi:inorganic pyrophosphatase